MGWGFWDVFLLGVDTPAADDDALDDDIVILINIIEENKEKYGSIIYGKANIKLYDICSWSCNEVLMNLWCCLTLFCIGVSRVFNIIDCRLLC